MTSSTAPDPDEARVERWARGLCAVEINPDGREPPGAPWWTAFKRVARAAIALADAEAANRVAGTDLWAKWEGLRGDLELAAARAANGGDAVMDRWGEARTAIDDFVRGLIVPKT